MTSKNDSKPFKVAPVDGTCFQQKRIKKRKCLLHRPDFRHQIAGASDCFFALNCFFALIRFKYSNLTRYIRNPDGVVVSALDCNAVGWDIDSRRTRFLNIALESYVLRFKVLFFLYNLIIRVRVWAAMPAWEIVNWTAKEHDRRRRCSSD